MKTYTESQKINIWLAYIPVCLLFLFFFYELIASLTGLSGFSSTPLSGILVGLGATLLTTIILAIAKLQTTITAEGITARFIPFNKKKFFWSEVESYSIRKSKVKGVGLKYDPFQRMMYYNTDFGEMLVLKLKNGKKFGVGTKEPERMQVFLEELFDSDEFNLLEDLQKNRAQAERLENRGGEDYV